MHAENAEEPWAVFESWFRAAVESGRDLPEAMTLATVARDGQPSARVVLYKGASAGGLTFYTNYHSEKAEELAAHPYAALVFHWPELMRQIRIRGRVDRLPPAESDAYFQTRPRGSQLGAWASAQSRPVASRQLLEASFREVAERFGDGPVPRPPGWGGYRLVPFRFEFWQGRPDRLHDRIVFERSEDDGGRAAPAWQRTRLAP